MNFTKRNLNMKKIIIIFTVALVSAELLIRLAGLADVPVRIADKVTGYIPAPNQEGKFLNNRWVINELSMITDKPYDKTVPNRILAGDSVVFGGNPLDQEERVASVASAVLGDAVYPIADGSWGFKNQINYFLKNKGLLGEPLQMAFLLNGGDFGTPSVWSCQSFHPREKPAFHLLFVAKKYFAPTCVPTPSDLQVPDYDLHSGLVNLFELYPQTRVTLILYPDRKDFKDKVDLTARLREHVDVALFDKRLEVVDLNSLFSSDPDLWEISFYSDGIHPSAEGAAAIGALLARRVFNN